MSHFVGLVFGKDVEGQLARYDENLEIAFKDNTEEYRQEYEMGTYKEYVKVNPNDYFSESKIMSEMPHKKKYPTFEEFVKDWEGSDSNSEGRYGYMHNPDAKWDWYQVGGRWSGFLKRKNLKDCKFPHIMDAGEPGVMGSHYAEGHDRVDVIALCDIDWEGMKKEATDYAAAHFDECLRKQADGEKNPFSLMNWGRTKEQGPFTRQEYIDSAASVVPYCIVVEGEWYERGQMIGFGLSTNDKPCEEWAKEVELLIDRLPEDTLVTVVDFHI